MFSKNFLTNLIVILTNCKWQSKGYILDRERQLSSRDLVRKGEDQAVFFYIMNISTRERRQSYGMDKRYECCSELY